MPKLGFTVNFLKRNIEDTIFLDPGYSIHTSGLHLHDLHVSEKVYDPWNLVISMELKVQRRVQLNRWLSRLRPIICSVPELVYLIWWAGKVW